METTLTVASKRDVRSYARRPIPEDVVARILDAGRLAGSAHNRQPWRFIVPEDPLLVNQIATTVFVPGTVVSAPLVVAIAVTPGGGVVDFDAGRAAQNMMLVAWDDGVASCPNGVADRDRLTRLLGLEESERAVVVLSFGYPERRLDPARRSVDEWSRMAWRHPLQRMVRRLPDTG